MGWWGRWSVGLTMAVAMSTGALAQSAPPRGVLPPQPQGQAPAATTPAAPPAPPAQATPPPPVTVVSGAATAEATPTAAVLGAPVYPGAVFLGSFNAGLGQRYYLFGSTADYAQVVTFYRNALKSRGSEVYDTPPVWSFDIGRFREESMAYPPSVVVRDHVAGGGRGYLHVAGTQSQRFPTVVQIVPPPPGDRRNP